MKTSLKKATMAGGRLWEPQGPLEGSKLNGNRGIIGSIDFLPKVPKSKTRTKNVYCIRPEPKWPVFWLEKGIIGALGIYHILILYSNDIMLFGMQYHPFAIC